MKITYNNNTWTVTLTDQPMYQMRIDALLSQKQLAKRMKISQAAVALNEGRERNGKPSLRYMHKAANAMGHYMEVELKSLHSEPHITKKRKGRPSTKQP